MALVNLGSELAEAEDQAVLPKNSECRCRVMAVRQDTDKNGNDYIMPLIEVLNSADFGIPNPKDFTYFMGMPHDGLDPKQKQRSNLKIKNFLIACGLEVGPFDPDTFVGCEFWAILGVDDNETYGEQNYIKTLVKGN